MGVRLATGGSEGRKVVTTAGTPVQLDQADAHTVTVTAETDNTGVIAVGFSNAVRAAAGSQKGALLAAGQAISIAVRDVNQLWIDASVNGEGVSLLWVR